MVYTGICARINGDPDLHGDILSENVIIPNDAVMVFHEFDNKAIIGYAFLERRENDIWAYVHLIDSEYNSNPRVIENFYAVVGGVTSKRNGSLVEEWSIKNIGLTLYPADKSLTKLEAVKYLEKK
jgi:hypothetical protein